MRAGTGALPPASEQDVVIALISKEALDRISDIAKEKGISATDCINDALDDYIRKNR